MAMVKDSDLEKWRRESVYVGVHKPDGVTTQPTLNGGMWLVFLAAFLLGP